jgi:hypothetical protein
MPKISVKDMAVLPAFRSTVLGARNEVASRVLLKNVVTETYKCSDVSHYQIHRAQDMKLKSIIYNPTNRLQSLY